MMKRFFLGIRLPKELEEQCERYRRAFKAPKTIAHITVISPFLWEKDVQRLIQLLEASLDSIRSFQISGNGIGSFGSRVLYINVTPTPELMSLHEALTLALNRAGVALDSRPYQPHLTLATRLNSEQFELYRSQLSDFEPNYAFACTHLTLFHFLNGRWEDWKELHFQV